MTGALVSAAAVVMPLLAAIVATALVVFGVRRVVFAVAAVLPRRRREPTPPNASMLLLVAARNEAAVIENFLRSLERVDYADGLLEVTLIDHGSTDATGATLARWAKGRPRTRNVTVSASPATAGKSVALAAGLSASMRTDLVAIADADFEMEADGLRRLADGFSDAKVGAVCGYLRPRNAGAGIVARYAALESWLHQLVTATAKDRLGLDPPLLGIWVVRRAVLDAVGGFPARSTGEDVQVGTAVSRHGFRTRFVPTPVASNAVAATLAEYWWQHLRWARDVYASARSRRPESQNLEGGGSSRASLGDLGRGIERLLSAAGYADRLALVAGMTLTALGALPSVILLAYLAAVALEIVVAIRRGGSRRLGETVRVLASVVAMVGVDVFATAVATVAAMAGTNPSWRRPARRPSP